MTRTKPTCFSAAGVLLAGLTLLAAGAQARESVLPTNLPATAPDTWDLLPERFESTGGGGWMIEGYRPVLMGAACVTAFSAVSPDGKERFPNTVSFTAVPFKGGHLCTDGRWRANDGSAEGTTPLLVWIKDGVVRRVP